jgi:hypothetical protein
MQYKGSSTESENAHFDSVESTFPFLYLFTYIVTYLVTCLITYLHIYLFTFNAHPCACTYLYEQKLPIVIRHLSSSETGTRPNKREVAGLHPQMER